MDCQKCRTCGWQDYEMEFAMPKTVSYAKWSLEPYCIGMKLRLLRTRSGSRLRAWRPRRGFPRLLSKLENGPDGSHAAHAGHYQPVYGVGMSYFFAEPANTRSRSLAKPTLQATAAGWNR